MKYVGSLMLILLLFTGCSRLNELKWDMTPEKWLETHSYSEIKLGVNSIIISEPSSSIIVFLLGIILAYGGIKILKNRENNRSRSLMGYGFLVWSLSTFFAGISYQAFSYVLKCQGREISLWTTWWEIWYLILFVVSMNLIASSVAYSSCTGKIKGIITKYTKINSIIYIILVLSGAFIPNRFMVSFECMVLFIAPTFISLLIINTKQYKINKNLIDKRFAHSWLLLFLTVFIYFAVLISNLATVLWDRGIWFNANDTLHIGLILWVVYFMIYVQKLIRDY